MNINQTITFKIPSDDMTKTGRIIQTMVTTVDGFELNQNDSPCVIVTTDDDQTWAVPTSWVVQ